MKLLIYLNIIVVFCAFSCNIIEHNEIEVKEELEMLYYEAQNQYDSGEYVKCIISLLEAEEIAQQLDDYYYLGLIYNSFRIVYGDSYDVGNALKYAKLSYDNFLKSDSSRLAEYALLDLGVSYINAGEYKKGLSIIENIAERKNHYENLVDGNIFVQLYSDVLVIMGEYEKAKNLIRPLIIELDLKNGRNYKNLAMCYKNLNMTDSAFYYLDKALDMVENDNLLKYRIKYEQAELRGDLKLSLLFFKKMMILQDSVIRTSMKTGVINAIEVYNDNNTEIMKLELERDRWLYCCVIILLLLLFTFIIVLIYKKYNEILKKNDAELKNVKEQMNNVLTQLNRNSSELSKVQLLVKKLFGQKFELINNLCDAYFECQNTQREKNVIYREAISMITAFGEKQTLLELENILNECNNDVISRVREQIPWLNEKEISLLLYLYCGFSASAVCLLIGDKKENYYNKKSRLKNKILKSGAEDRDEFIELMNS